MYISYFSAIPQQQLQLPNKLHSVSQPSLVQAFQNMNLVPAEVHESISPVRRSHSFTTPNRAIPMQENQGLYQHPATQQQQTVPESEKLKINDR